MSKWASLPAVVRALAARSGRFATITWGLIRQRRCSFAKKPSSTSPAVGARPPSAARWRVPLREASPG
eukprot:4760493-Alexandrium_andersonii.AAC.1